MSVNYSISTDKVGKSKHNKHNKEDNQSTRDSPELQGIEPLSGIEVYTMNAQPSPPGSHRSYRYGHK